VPNSIIWKNFAERSEDAYPYKECLPIKGLRDMQSRREDTQKLNARDASRR